MKLLYFHLLFQKYHIFFKRRFFHLLQTVSPLNSIHLQQNLYLPISLPRIKTQKLRSSNKTHPMAKQKQTIVLPLDRDQCLKSSPTSMCLHLTIYVYVQYMLSEISQVVRQPFDKLCGIPLLHVGTYTTTFQRHLDMYILIFRKIFNYGDI